MQINDLSLLTLKDIHFAERQLLKALPEMAFTNHREGTQGQVEPLQRVFEIPGKRAAGQTCEPILGLIQECEELLEEAPAPSAVRDAGLIARGRAVEHCEMARYTTLAAWPQLMQQEKIAALLRANLAEAESAEALLTEVAETSVHSEALAEA